MTNVLLIDSSSARLEVLAAALHHAGNNPTEESVAIFLYSPHEKSVYKLLQGPASADPMKGFALRLRHAGDFQAAADYQTLPPAQFNVCYGGGGARETRYHPGEYRYNVACFDNKTKAEAAFPVDAARMLLEFAVRADDTAMLPACLLPETYDADLEYRLEAAHQQGAFMPPEEGLRRADHVVRRALILWPHPAPGQEYLRQALLDKLFTADAATSFTIMTNAQVYESLSPGERTAFDTVVICPELKWQTPYYTDFEGIDLLADLRRAGYRGPVILASHVSWAIFETLQRTARLRFDVLKTPGQFFYSLHDGTMPAAARREFADRTDFWLSLELLNDIQYYILDQHGQLHSAFHSLKNRISHDADEARRQIRDLFEQRLVQIFGVIYLPLLHRIGQEILHQIAEQPDAHYYYDLVEPVFPQLVALLSESESDTAVTAGDWGVLYVDDQPDECKRVREFFEAHHIVCYTATTVKQALRILHVDYHRGLSIPNGRKPRNFIHLLLSDYRLLVDDHPNARWQTWQGYDLIDYAHRSLPNMLALGMLTHKRGAILRQARRRSPINVAWFSKELLLDPSVARYLLGDLRELGDESYNALHTAPTSSSWRNGVGGKVVALQLWYRYYRNCKIYGASESRINALAHGYLQLAVWRRELEAVDMTRLPEAERAKRQDAVRQLEESLRTDPFNREFSAKLVRLPDESPDALDVFLAKLLGRRIVIGLVRLVGLRTLADINDVLHLYFSNKSEYPIDQGLFSTHFALSSKIERIDASELLLEESAFLDWAKDSLRQKPGAY